MFRPHSHKNAINFSVAIGLAAGATKPKAVGSLRINAKRLLGLLLSSRKLLIAKDKASVNVTFPPKAICLLIAA